MFDVTDYQKFDDCIEQSGELDAIIIHMMHTLRGWCMQSKPHFD